MKAQQTEPFQSENFKLPDRYLRADPDRYLRKEEVAHILSVTPRTVDNLMARGILPFIKMGARMVRFRLADINAQLESSCRVERKGS